MAETWAVKIDEEEKERLSGLIEQSGLSAKDFLTSMVSVYELTKAKDNIPLLSEDINELQRITTRMNTIYTNIGERIQSLLDSKEQEYKKQIEEKQTTIKILNEKNIELNTTKEENKTKILILQEKIDELQKQLINEQELKKTSQNLIDEYKQKVNTIETEIQEHKAIREENKKLQQQINELNNEINNSKLENEKLGMKLVNLEKEVKEVNQKHIEEIRSIKDSLTLQGDKEKLKMKEEYQSKIQVLQEQYNQKVQELLEKMEQKNKN